MFYMSNGSNDYAWRERGHLQWQTCRELLPNCVVSLSSSEFYCLVYLIVLVLQPFKFTVWFKSHLSQLSTEHVANGDRNRATGFVIVNTGHTFIRSWKTDKWIIMLLSIWMRNQMNQPSSQFIHSGRWVWPSPCLDSFALILLYVEPITTIYFIWEG